MASIDTTTAQHERPPPARPGEQGKGRGREEQAPRATAHRTRGDRLRQLREVGPAEGLCCTQQVDQAVDDEQHGEGGHGCSRPWRRRGSHTDAFSGNERAASCAGHFWLNSVAACAKKGCAQGVASGHRRDGGPPFPASTGRIANIQQAPTESRRSPVEIRRAFQRAAPGRRCTQASGRELERHPRLTGGCQAADLQIPVRSRRNRSRSSRGRTSRSGILCSKPAARALTGHDRTKWDKRA